MSNAIAKTDNSVSMAGLERVLIEGNLSALTPDQRVQYYQRVCESVGLNPLTQPFEYLTLQGKMILYARRACTDQLRQIHRISVTVTSREKVDGIYVVTARATWPDGRTDESIGAVPVENLKGENYANALMKAETKAKRRVTLAICGLAFLDELEVESVQSAAPARVGMAALPANATPESSAATSDRDAAIAAAAAQGFVPDSDASALAELLDVRLVQCSTVEQFADVAWDLAILVGVPSARPEWKRFSEACGDREVVWRDAVALAKSRAQKAAS